MSIMSYASSDTQKVLPKTSRSGVLYASDFKHLDKIQKSQTQQDVLPRINNARLLLLCPQGGVTFNDSKQCLGTGGPDFGGQLVYLKSLAPSLRDTGFAAVDIVTRSFEGHMASGQAFPQEFKQKIEVSESDPNLRVVRLPCGGNQFLPKESLWPHLREWTNNIDQFYRREMQEHYLSGEQGNHYKEYTPIVTAHYADAGLAAYLLQRNEGYPFATMTAHSLGAQKKATFWPHLREWTNNIDQFYRREMQEHYLSGEQGNHYKEYTPIVTAHYADAGLAAYLLQRNEGYPFATMTAHSLGAQKKATFESNGQDTSQYKFKIRLPAEKRSARSAGALICNSKAEKELQWHASEYKDAVDDAKLHVVPPGISNAFGQKRNEFNLRKCDTTERKQASAALQQGLALLKSERQGLPTILMCGRFDRKKGYKEALQAFAQSPELKAKANIVFLFANAPAILKEPDVYLKGGAAAYAHEVKQLIEQEQLQDYLVIPDLPQINQTHLSEIYRALSKDCQSIYCHAAYTEPFGLAILEALSEGMLVAATDNGGAVSILEDGRYGELMDVSNAKSIESSLLKILNMPQEDKQKRQAAGEIKSSDYRWAKTGHDYAQLIDKQLSSL